MKLYKVVTIIVLIVILYRCLTYKSSGKKNGQALPTKTRYQVSASWKMIDQVPENFICGIPNPKVGKWFGRIGGALKQDKGCGNCWAYASCTMVSDRWRIYDKNVMQYNEEIGDLDYIDPVHAAQMIICKDGRECKESCDSQYIDEMFIKMQDDNYPAFPTKLATSNFIDRPAYKISKFFRVGQWNEDDLNARPDRIAENEDAIKKEIFLYGPVTATIKIYKGDDDYDDRDLYKLKDTSRIYGDWREGPPSDNDGYHSIVIVGWGESTRNYTNGVDSNPRVKWWYCRNSWGKSYCDGGFFKVLRGQNAAIIESDCFGAIPKLDEQREEKQTDFVLGDMSA